MKPLIWAGIALQLCAVPAFAQSTPATTPSTPPVTTPPLPAAQPPSGGPNSMPTAEPANVVDKSGVTPGANSFTESQAMSRLRQDGYTQVSALNKGDDGIWRGSASKNGTPVHVQVDYKGRISSN